jgi:hypothetical protein
MKSAGHPFNAQSGVHHVEIVLAASAAAVLLSGTSAVAQTKAPATRSPASLECSKQADAKGLKGKARKKFRSKCMKEMKGKAA